MCKQIQGPGCLNTDKRRCKLGYDNIDIKLFPLKKNITLYLNILFG